jgi:phospholipase C
MIAGENYIKRILTPLMTGPQWPSTAVFLTWDDCGCFYDEVAPPDSQFAVRVPMIIISPFVRSEYTDTASASYPSILAFIEHNFALRPLNPVDADIYDYSGSFDYDQAPLGPVKLVTRPIPKWELRYMEKHPVVDPDDPVSGDVFEE